MVVDPAVEAQQVERLKAWRAERDAKAVKAALADLERAAKEGRNIMEPSIACAKAGVTTGEWGGTLRKVFGEYRAPTGVAQAAVAREPVPGSRTCAKRSRRLSAKIGRRIKFLVGKPGLDGHSNGAEQIAVRARDCRHGGRLRGHPPDAGADRARRARRKRTRRRAVDPVGQPCAARHEVMERMRKEGLGDVPVVVGGIIPPEDAVQAQSRSAWRRCTRPRTSSSTTSWPTS